MTYSSQASPTSSQEKVTLDTKKQNLKHKKIYFDSDGTEIKIGYDDETGIGFVEIISD
jgi:hypothetical protein